MSEPPYPPRSAVEAELWRNIASHDDASRDIYADWLETNGHLDEAAFVRVQGQLQRMSTEDIEFRATSEALRTLGHKTNRRWRQRIAQPAIENCTSEDVPRFNFKCPKQWGGLEPTTDPTVRHCGACDKSVHYCTTIPDARYHASAGRCVALDIGAMRWRGDLAAPRNRECRGCRADLGNFSGSICPRCATQIIAYDLDDIVAGDMAE
ncbi:MAG: TIGR02996 domain-containing protein [Kofleriaceae bacterium]